MHVYVLTKDPLEAQGIKWMISSQLRDVSIEIEDSVEGSIVERQSGKYDFFIIDLDILPVMEESFLPAGSRWLGLSSNRTFQTAYGALKHKAEDVLFRPFQPEQLIKIIHQARFRLRNEQSRLPQDQTVQNTMFTYQDLLLTETFPNSPLLVSAIVSSNKEHGSEIVRTLEGFSFPTQFQVFPFSDFTLVVHRLSEQSQLTDAYASFYALWKQKSDTLLSFYLYESEKGPSMRSLYQKMRRYQERIFYDGYDIVSVETQDLTWRELDPFLSPIEQRIWIEMLEKQDVKAIRDWLEQDFLVLEAPFPDPEMVRIRLTSVLAQIRRFMTAKSMRSVMLEKQYHQLFQDIIREPVMYIIIQKLNDFIGLLMKEPGLSTSGQSSFPEKVRSMMESNYWNPTWNLAACADALNINKSTLSRKYHQTTGVKFRDALQEIRIREAKRLLKESDASLEEVSRLSGFTHQSYFNAKFKTATGQTPSSYRF
ncbi:MAG: helix-turn-helix transcriptional regulator [Planococcaceae bacterium]|nr:helix-turn-helix transcriptional regulator [Planococcaceae bacterium]